MDRSKVLQQSSAAKPRLWRHGIARALVTEATHEARRQGLALVVARQEMREFYQKCGIEVEGVTETASGPALNMSR